MKIDMHCHTKEGSVDSKAGLEEYITKLKEKGFEGMLITDHDTYRGYRYWKNQIKGFKHKDFVVLKGMEYDTLDAGHILIIMPEGVRMRLLELKGLPVSVLINFVHHHGGVLGPAHPGGEKYLSYMNTKRFRKSPEITKRFDFIEVFNACEPEESNQTARKLAEEYGKIGVGGSDAHRLDCVSMGYTILPQKVTCETELISLIHKQAEFQTGGTLYTKTTKEKIGRINTILVYSFWFYNQFGAWLRRGQRKRQLSSEQPIDPIDPMDIPYLNTIKRVSYKKSNE